MKIIEVNIPKNESLGLEEIKMKRLEQVVILAGKNGSGKTRVLNSILQLNRTRSLGLVDNFEKIIITDSRDNKKIGIIEFVPKSLNLVDSGTLTQNDLVSYRDTLLNPGLQSISSATFATIQLTQDNWLNATHPNSFIDKTEREVIVKGYEDLTSLISTFLNTELTRDKDGYCLMFGKRFSTLNLSDGQKIILQLCAAIFSQQASLSDLVLFLDEPENHLHPQALKEVIAKIKECIPNGQIWIATHSISLLSQFDPNSIWYVDRGKVEHAGKTPEKVLKGLLGEDDDISKLQDFLDLPSQFAVSRYAMECLLPPDVLMTGSQDPQIKQIKEALNALKGDAKLKILDFGAGKGRLLNNLNELYISENKILSDSIDYVAFDLFEADRDICAKNIADVYGDSKNKYYNSILEIFEHHDKKSFDVVVMCNVFHEIDPMQWIKIFKENGDLDNVIKDDGYLLVVEDNQIPKGEKAYTKGFLVLDTLHLKELFKIPSTETKFIVDSQREGRLKAHLIPKQYLKNIDQQTIKTTLETVRDSSILKINKLREKEPPTYADGKLHAFYSQQLTNSVLTLDQLS